MDIFRRDWDFSKYDSDQLRGNWNNWVGLEIDRQVKCGEILVSSE